MSSGKRIIAITGKKGSGKSTLAEKIAQFCVDCPLSSVRLSYGYNIRRVASIVSDINQFDLRGLSREDRDKVLTCWKWDELHPALALHFPNHGEFVTASELLDIVAEELFRNSFSPMVWIKALDSDIMGAFNASNIVIISDLRRCVELDALRKRAPVTVIKVINPDQLRDNHPYPTEAEVDFIPADYLYYSKRDRSEEQVTRDFDSLINEVFGFSSTNAIPTPT